MKTPGAVEKITVSVEVRAPLETVWRKWTSPEDVKAWNSASDDWHTPAAENYLRPGGTFCYRMAAKDGGFGFDFSGTYDEVSPGSRIAYTLGDGRKVSVTFGPIEDGVRIIETFDAEASNPLSLQQAGWQAILDRFKRYAESA